MLWQSIDSSKIGKESRRTTIVLRLEVTGFTEDHALLIWYSLSSRLRCSSSAVIPQENSKRTSIFADNVKRYKRSLFIKTSSHESDWWLIYPHESQTMLANLSHRKIMHRHLLKEIEELAKLFLYRATVRIVLGSEEVFRKSIMKV